MDHQSPLCKRANPRCYFTSHRVIPRMSPFLVIPMTHSRALAATALTVTLVFSLPAFAHHAGGAGNTGGAGPINTISASTLEHGHAVAGVVVDYTRLNTLSDATLINATAAGLEGVHDLKTLQSFALVGAYGVTNDLTVSFHVPFVKRTGIRAAEADPNSGVIDLLNHGGSDGFGDVSALGQYRFFNDRASQTEAAVLFGLKAPTGPTDRRSRQNELLDAEFQPGSGSWDFSVGAAATHRVGQWSFDANVLYIIATEGTQNTELGDLFQYNAAISYRLAGLGHTGQAPMFHGGHSHETGDDGHAHALMHDEAPAGPAFDLILELNGQWHGKQVTNGVTDENSGASTIFISPGLRVSVGQVSAFASVGIPVLNDFNGIQPDNDWHLSTGVMVTF